MRARIPTHTHTHTHTCTHVHTRMHTPTRTHPYTQQAQRAQRGHSATYTSGNLHEQNTKTKHSSEQRFKGACAWENLANPGCGEMEENIGGCICCVCLGCSVVALSDGYTPARCLVLFSYTHKHLCPYPHPHTHTSTHTSTHLPRR